MLRVGTRVSKLALAQTYDVIAQLKGFNIDCTIIPIQTTGDIIDKPLTEIGGKALFLKELENALLCNQIDIAVHSLKDVPAILPDNLTIPSVLKRHTTEDVLIASNTLNDLAIGSTIGTCSSRRQAFLQYHFQDKFNLINLRGNIDTRINKVLNNEIDGIIIAKAGVERLQISHYITEVISTEMILPSIGQGVIAIECKQNNNDVIDILKKINHHDTFQCILAERSFMLAMNGTCKTPIAGLATIENTLMCFKGAFIMPNGSRIFIHKEYDCVQNAINLGAKVANIIQNDIQQSQYFSSIRHLIGR